MVRPREIIYREELPPKLRQPIIDILRHSFSSAFLWDRIERQFNPYGIDSWPVPGAPIPISKEEDGPQFVAAKRFLLQCEWFRIYDLIESLFDQLDFHDTEFRNPDEEFQADPFRRNLNDYFEYAVRNLSFRPKPRLGAAVARATNAMECLPHDITGEEKMTFGDYLHQYS